MVTVVPPLGVPLAILSEAVLARRLAAHGAASVAALVTNLPYDHLDMPPDDSGYVAPEQQARQRIDALERVQVDQVVEMVKYLPSKSTTNCRRNSKVVTCPTSTSCGSSTANSMS